MAVTSFLALTDTDQVRAVLGLDSKDIADSKIACMQPEDDLTSNLLEWVPTYQTIITEGNGASPTDEQTLKYLKLKLYAKYFIAVMVVSGGINSILQKLSDGSNEGARFTNVSLKELKADMQEKADAIKAELVLIITPTTTSTYSQFGTASPAIDQVTLEET